MNEACSAGTGSFIEEQGRKFAGIRDVVQLGREALAAREGVSLGQHCSVFMAEVIDEAVAAGVSAVTAVRMATINTANRFRLSDRGAITTGRRADLVVFDDITRLIAARTKTRTPIARKMAVMVR